VAACTRTLQNIGYGKLEEDELSISIHALIYGRISLEDFAGSARSDDFLPTLAFHVFTCEEACCDLK
jgi:hypothetical protein